MHTITCARCGASLEDRRKGAKYCTEKCGKAFRYSSAKKTKEAKPLNECENCKKPTKNKHYCSRECWSLHAEMKRNKRVLANFPRSRFGMWLLGNVKRAGTVQVLESTTHKGFSELNSCSK